MNDLQNEKTNQKPLLKIILWILFAIYFLICIIRLFIDNTFTTNTRIVFIVVQIVIFCPLLLTIVLDKGSYAVLILLLYELFSFISNLYQVYACTLVVNTEDNQIVFQMISSIFLLVLSVFLVVRAINIIRNKRYLKNTILILLFICNVIMMIVSFVIDATSGMDINYFLLISSISLSGITSMYLIFYPHREYRLFV